jgi:hypothetical protein
MRSTAASLHLQAQLPCSSFWSAQPAGLQGKLHRWLLWLCPALVATAGGLSWLRPWSQLWQLWHRLLPQQQPPSLLPWPQWQQHQQTLQGAPQLLHSMLACLRCSLVPFAVTSSATLSAHLVASPTAAVASCSGCRAGTPPAPTHGSRCRHTSWPQTMWCGSFKSRCSSSHRQLLQAVHNRLLLLLRQLAGCHSRWQLLQQATGNSQLQHPLTGRLWRTELATKLRQLSAPHLVAWAQLLPLLLVLRCS